MGEWFESVLGFDLGLFEILTFGSISAFTLILICPPHFRTACKKVCLNTQYVLRTDPVSTRTSGFCRGGRCWENRDKVRGTEDAKGTTTNYFMCPVQCQGRTDRIKRTQSCRLVQTFHLQAQAQIPVGPLSELISPAIFFFLARRPKGK